MLGTEGFALLSQTEEDCGSRGSSSLPTWRVARLRGPAGWSVGPRRHYARDGLLRSLRVITHIDIVCVQQL